MQTTLGTEQQYTMSLSTKVKVSLQSQLFHTFVILFYIELYYSPNNVFDNNVKTDLIRAIITKINHYHYYSMVAIETQRKPEQKKNTTEKNTKLPLDQQPLSFLPHQI